MVIRTKLEEVGGIGGTKWINLTEHGVRDEGTARIMHERPIIPR